MIALPPGLKVFLGTHPADMRRGFDGLCGMASGLMQQNPLSGHLFLFRNRVRNRLKILYWDRDGLAIWYKRLEQDTWQFPSDLKKSDATLSGVEIAASNLWLLLQGIDLRSVCRRKHPQNWNQNWCNPPL